MEPLIEIEHLTYGYEESPVLEDVSSRSAAGISSW